METIKTFEINGKFLKIVTSELETAASQNGLETDVNAPGFGEIEISPLTLSADQIASGESLSLSAQINGNNIAFIYTEILFQDNELAQYYGPMVQEFVAAEKNEQVQGVIYPNWGAEINLLLNLTPSLRVLTDGFGSAFAFMEPINYAQEGYQLDGLFIRQESSKARRARLKLNSDGEITDALVYKEKGSRSSVHALTFQTGDRFTPFVQILTPPSDENYDWQATRGFSTTLTRGETAFRWTNDSPGAGNYLLGLIVQDLDGNRTRKYVPFTING